ncbi:MAG: nucleotidyl transferase AbiEii/AbiGii toxin family protein [Xanthobacteraceae bacterium]
MPDRFEPKLDILPQPQRQLWPLLAPLPELGYVLYGGTAVALHLGHRTSLDFDFFRAEPMDKQELLSKLRFVKQARTVQEDKDTLVAMVGTSAGEVKVSFFGGIGFGRVNDPLQTNDSVLLVASLDDLMTTKLKAMLDRAEAKDYRDISAMLSAGVPLAKGLGAFTGMFKKDPVLPLRAIGYFKDGDLATLPKPDQNRLRKARDAISSIPKVPITGGSLAVKTTDRTP